MAAALQQIDGQDFVAQRDQQQVAVDRGLGQAEVGRVSRCVPRLTFSSVWPQPSRMTSALRCWS